MENLSNSLAQAIAILFAQGGNWSAEQKQAANSFILEANNRPESFPALLHILGEPSYSLVIKFFACNLLNEKVRKQWSHLQEHERREVADQLMQIIQTRLPALPDSSEANTYRGRVVLAFSSACVRLSDGLNLCHAAVQQLFRAAEPASYCIALDLLSKINEEIDISDLQRDRKQELQAACQQALPQHLAYIDQVLQCENLQDSALLSSIVFLASCCTTKMLTLRSFSSDYPRLFSRLLSCLVPPWRPPRFHQACIACRELAIMREYPRSQAGQLALDQVNEQLSSAVCHILPVYVQDSYRTDSLLSCMVDLCETLVVLLSAQQEELIEGRPQTVQVAACLLKVVAQRPRSLIMLTFDFWAEMENFSEEERANGVFNQLVVKDLLSALLALIPSCHQPSAVTFDEDEDRETFRDLRLGLDDALGMCCEALPGHFLQSLALSVENFRSQPQGHAHGMEACLFALHACMARIKSCHAQDAQVLAFLLHTASVALSHHASLQQGVGVEAGRSSLSNFLGSLAFLLGNANLRQESLGLLARSLPWLLSQVLEYEGGGGADDQDEEEVGGARPTASQAAAKAFHRLVLAAGRLLYEPFVFVEEGWTASSAAIESILRHFTARYRPGREGASTCVADRLLVVEALVRSVIACPHATMISPWLGILSRPVVEGLSALFSCPPSAQRTVQMECLLGYWSQMLRFCDVPQLRGENSSHMLMAVLQEVWPLLLQVEATMSEEDALLAKLWEIFGRTVVAFGPCIASLVPSMVSLLLSHVQRPGKIAAAPALWECATVLADFLANHIPEGLTDGRMLHFLSALIHAIAQRTQIVAASPHLFVAVADPCQTFGLDLEGMDAFARCLLALISSARIRPVLAPRLQAGPPEGGSGGDGGGLMPVLVSTVMVFIRSSAEKDPLRNLHTVLQTVFSPSRFSLQFEHSAQYQHLVIQSLLSLVPSILTVLLAEISSPRLGGLVISNVAEALCGILASLASEGLQDRGEEWLVQVLYSEDILCPSLPVSMRKTLGRVMVVLAAHQQRRFKALLVDVYKVCCSEATADVLVAYEDALL